jgi:hypothetical protein
VGVALVRGDRLLLRQYVMRDYDEEPAMLQAVADDLRGVRHLVSFNGRGFDLPVLEARYRLNRARPPVAEAVHLDLLPPARRLWGERFESCRLQALEAELLGLRRTGDVPGEEIPRLYFDWLRSRNARGLAPVLEHNRLDVVSLAALLAFCCGWIEEARRRRATTTAGARVRAGGRARPQRGALPARGGRGRARCACVAAAAGRSAKRAASHTPPCRCGRGRACGDVGAARAGHPSRAPQPRPSRGGAVEEALAGRRSPRACGDLSGAAECEQSHARRA